MISNYGDANAIALQQREILRNIDPGEGDLCGIEDDLRVFTQVTTERGVKCY